MPQNINIFTCKLHRVLVNNKHLWEWFCCYCILQYILKIFLGGWHFITEENNIKLGNNPIWRRYLVDAAWLHFWTWFPGSEKFTRYNLLTFCMNICLIFLKSEKLVSYSMHASFVYKNFIISSYINTKPRDTHTNMKFVHLSNPGTSLYSASH